MSNIETALYDLAREIERVLSMEPDPVKRMVAADKVRADLAVALTRQIRRSAWEARRDRRIDDMRAASFRGRDYLNKMATQYANDEGLPTHSVRDIINTRLLDLNDLARLRGSTR